MVNHTNLIDSQTKLYINSKKSEESKGSEEPEESEESEEELDYFEALVSFFQECNSEFPNAKELISDIPEDDKITLFQSTLETLDDNQFSLFEEFESFLKENSDE